MNASPIAACLEQVVPALQKVKPLYSLPGEGVEELYTRLCNRRQEDPDIDAVCNIFEQFLTLDNEGAMEIVVVFEKHVLHQHMINHREV